MLEGSLEGCVLRGCVRDFIPSGVVSFSRSSVCSGHNPDRMRRPSTCVERVCEEGGELEGGY